MNENIRQILEAHQLHLAGTPAGQLAKLRDRDLTGTDFTGLSLGKADLKRSNLTNCRMPADCQGTILVDAKGMNCSWVGSDITGSRLENANPELGFIGAIWNGTTITRCSAWITTEGYRAFATNAFLQIGCTTRTLAEWEAIGATRESLTVLHQADPRIDLEMTWNWWNQHKQTIRDWYAGG